MHCSLVPRVCAFAWAADAVPSAVCRCCAHGVGSPSFCHSSVCWELCDALGLTAAILVLAGIELISSSCYGAVWYRMRILLITHRCLVIAELWCSEPKAFQHLTLPCLRGAGGTERAGGDRARTADPNCPKGCPTPCVIMWNYRTGGVGWGSVGGWWAIALWIICFLSSFIIIIFPFFSALLNCVYLNPWILPFFLILFPSQWVGKSKQLCGAELPAGLNHSNSFWCPTWGTKSWDNSGFLKQEPEWQELFADSLSESLLAWRCCSCIEPWRP